MSALRSLAIAAGAALLATTLTTPADATTGCREDHAEQTLVMGATHQEVHIDAWATVCPTTTTITGATVTSDRPVLVKAAELYRYRRPYSQGAVRSAALKVPGKATTGIPIWVNRRVATHQPGYAGFLRLTVKASGETRTVAAHL